MTSSDHDEMTDDAYQHHDASDSMPMSLEPPPIPTDNASVPKPKRLACMICRKRKLKCDGSRPSCSTCARLGHNCAYDEQRRKSGPKRGYVKALEERLKQVETLLKTQDPPSSSAVPARAGPSTSTPNPPLQREPTNTSANGVSNGWFADGAKSNDTSPKEGAPSGMGDMGLNNCLNVDMNANVGGGDFTWEMIGLGLEEPLPPQETIDELHQIYFEKVHPSMPMVHKYRYLAAMNLAPNSRPPVCLRYAMWTMACSIADKFQDIKDLFYHRARKYLEADYVKGYGEHMISVAHCQTHILLSNYEMKMMFFPRAWVNTGSAVRLAQMIGLHRLDGQGLEVKQCLPAPKDWTEREERRRTFWMAFCEDRYASIGTGWPMVLDERDIMTNLPASEEAYDMSKPEQTQSLQEVTSSAQGASRLSSFAGVVLMASLFGRNLIHLHRPDSDDLDEDVNGPFWKRHRQLDAILLNTSLCLPDHLKLPVGLSNPNVVFTNMSIHTSTICLHQAAIFKADKNKSQANIGSESKVRCITAANEIASIMRTISHMDLAAMNPFISFCLYVAARVFVQYLKSRPEDSQTADSLRFLVSAMNALKRRNPLTESFLVQLDVDLEALAIRIPKLRGAFARIGDDAGYPGLGKVNKTGAVCDDPDGVQGIMAYRNECHFMKTVGDSGNLAEVPGLGEEEQASNNPRVDISNTEDFAGQNWLGTGNQVISGTTPNSGTFFDRSTAFGDSVGDGSASKSPEGQQSNSNLTPNSSTGPESRSHLGPGRMGGSGRNSFQASPISPQQAFTTQGAMDMSGQRQGFFATDTGGFAALAAGTMAGQQQSQSQNSFGSMTQNSWGDMSGMPQMGGQAVGEDMLRTMMSLGPMDALDLSTWSTGNDDNMRQ